MSATRKNPKNKNKEAKTKKRTKLKEVIRKNISFVSVQSSPVQAAHH